MTFVEFGSEGKEGVKIDFMPLTAIQFLSIFQSALAILSQSTLGTKTSKPTEEVISGLLKKPFSEERNELSCI